jgi:hypothetical protein
VAVFFASDLGRFLDPGFIRQQQEQINNYNHENPWRTISIYFLTYVLMAALSLPGAVWVTLIGRTDCPCAHRWRTRKPAGDTCADPPGEGRSDD